MMMRATVLVCMGSVLLVGAAKKTGEKPTAEKEGSVPCPLTAVDGDLQKRIMLGPQRLGKGNGGDSFIVGYAEAQRRLLAAGLAKGPPPAEAVALRLAAANWELGAAAATPVSRILFGIETPADVEALGTIAAVAGQHLKGLDDLMKQAELDEEKEDEIVGVHLVLEAFQQTLAFLADPAAAEDKKRVQSVLTSTALLLEDDRAAVQAAAEMYQAYVLARTGNVERGLAVLKLVLTPPASEAADFSLARKLLRLRLLIQAGRSTAAWALALRAEEHNKSRGDLFGRALAVRRLEATAGLQKDAESRDDADTVAWCEKHRRELLAEAFEGDRPLPIFRLDGAIPQLVEPPERPEWISLFGLPTAAPSMVFVVDLSSAVIEAQRRELHRKVDSGCQKLGPTQQFGIVVAGSGSPRVFGGQGLRAATEENRGSIDRWLAETKVTETTKLPAAIQAGGDAKSIHLLLVTDRAGEKKWLDALVGTAAGGKTHVDVIHVRPEAQKTVREKVESVGGRYVHIERQKAEEPSDEAAPARQEREKDETKDENIKEDDVGAEQE